jgi:acyl-CoA synthetase (AMP-forming)/AMP-acid ligase II
LKNMAQFRYNAKMSSLIHPVIQRAQTQPEAPVITLVTRDQHKTLSAAEFIQTSKAAAGKLQASGIAAGDLVILVLEHSLDLVSMFWGAQLLGAIPSIFPFLTEKLDPDIYRERVKTLVEHSGAKAVVTYQDNLAPLQHLLHNVDCAILTPGVEATETMTFETREVSPDSIALLQHSSGTTGLQKGVALSHRAVLKQIDAYAKSIKLDPKQDVVVSWLPLYHDMGLIAGFVMPIVTGTHLVIMSPFDWVRQPRLLLELVTQYKGTLSWLPNFAYNHIARGLRDTQGLNLDSWRAAINCSEPVYDESHRVFLDKLAPLGFTESRLAVSYAMAENTFAVTQTELGKPPRVDTVEITALQERGEAIAAQNGKRFVSCGNPIETVELAIFDEQRNPLPERRVGEIALRSDFMLSGYYKRPDLTEQALNHEGWYFTGDMGYLADGELYITGRKKDLIIVGGKNIYPQDLEALASHTNGIRPGRAVAFGVLDERLGSEKIVMVCEIEEGSDPAAIEPDLRAKVVQETEVTLGDLRLVTRGWVIKTSSGKHARRDNREKYLREFINQQV